MRFITGGIMHETHSFSVEPTTEASFTILRGQECFEWRGTNHSLGGVIDACETDGIDLAPTYFATALSTAPPSADVFESMLAELEQRVVAGLPADGVVLTLHGAMVAENFLDADAEIVRRIRNVVPQSIPMAITLDLHANIGPALLEGVSIITVYDTYPHVDGNERAQEAVRLLARTVREEIRPTMALCKPPILAVPQAMLTSEPPFSDLFTMVHEFEQHDDVLSVSLAGGFAYSDAPESGISVLAITDANVGAAGDIARTVGVAAWGARDAMVITNSSPTSAVAEAMSFPQRPVILADVGDNIGGGTPGDGTVLLAEMIAQNAQDAVVVINDPAAAAHAIRTGEGTDASFTIGGKTDRLHGDPVTATGRVVSICDGNWIHEGPENAGVAVAMGPTAVVRVGGISVVLTTHKTAPGDLQQLRSVGIEPTEQQIIVVKSAVRWRGGYGPIHRHAIHVDTPGLGSINLHAFPFQHLTRPIFGLDPSFDWQAPACA